MHLLKSIDASAFNFRKYRNAEIEHLVPFETSALMKFGCVRNLNCFE